MPLTSFPANMDNGQSCFNICGVPRRISIVIAITILVSSLIVMPRGALAQLSSDSFRMTSDSLNCGGGQSTSTSFSVFGTICEPAANQPTNNIVSPSSANFVLEQGFQYMEDIPFISVSLLNPSNTSSAKNSISFGELTPSGGTASDSILVRVRTNAASGYSASVISDGELRSGTGVSQLTISGVSDGAINGSPVGEYGFSVSSTDTTNCTRPTDDRSVTTAGTTFTSCTVWKALSDNTLTFKAAVSSTNSTGIYSQAVTIVVSGSF